MAYKIMHFVIIYFVMLFQVNAKEISLLDQEEIEPTEVSLPKDEKTVLIKDADNLENKTLDAMREFMNLENERLREIKLLDLDVTRANLRLKQREAETKLVQLNQEYAIPSSKISSNDPLVSPMVLKGVMKVGKEYQAIARVKDKIINVKEGDELDIGLKVLRIENDKVVYKGTNDEEMVLSLGG
jgi:hypothetical protein